MGSGTKQFKGPCICVLTGLDIGGLSYCQGQVKIVQGPVKCIIPWQGLATFVTRPCHT